MTNTHSNSSKFTAKIESASTKKRVLTASLHAKHTDIQEKNIDVPQVSVDKPVPLALTEVYQLHQNGHLQRALQGYLQHQPTQQHNIGFLANLGALYIQLGELEQGVAVLTQAVNLHTLPATHSSSYVNALRNLISASQQLQQPQAVVDWVGVLKQTGQPLDVHVHRAYAVALSQVQQYDAAIEAYKQLLEQLPYDATLYNAIGVVFADSGLYLDALPYYDNAIAFDAMNADAFMNKTAALRKLDRHHDAIVCGERALVLRPDTIDFLNSHANSYRAVDQFEEAYQTYLRCLALDAHYKPALSNIASMLHQRLRHAESVVFYTRLIDVLRADVLNVNTLEKADKASATIELSEALRNKAKVLNELNRREEALQLLDELAPIDNDPNLTQIYRGLVLMGLERGTDAIALFERLLTEDAEQTEVWINLGLAYQSLCQLDQAIMAYQKALEVSPDNDTAAFNLSMAYLTVGDFERGFALYETRRQRDDFKYLHQYNAPLWLGEVDIRGKTLLLHPEQGLGDSLQMLRYVDVLQASGVHVILTLPAELVTLAQHMRSSPDVYLKGQPLPHYDYQCPFMSLPLALKTTLSTVPNTVPYLFAPATNMQFWHQHLSERVRDTTQRVGLVWSGSVGHKNDFRRSMPLATLTPLQQLRVELHSLQREYRDSDKAVLQTLGVHDHSVYLRDFCETAGLIAHMDVVISVDTSVAHLAAAMGKPVLLMLPTVVDYRWLLEGTTSAWYPTMTLFRQQQAGEWRDVVQAIYQHMQLSAQHTQL